MRNHKIIAAVSAIALTAAVGGGAYTLFCAAHADAAQQTTAQQAAAQHEADAAQKAAMAKASNGAKRAVAKPAAAKTEAKPAATQAPAANGYVGERTARDAALYRAGLCPDDVHELQVELDLDDGPAHYDVDFKSGATEYDVDVDAVTGDVTFITSEIDD